MCELPAVYDETLRKSRKEHRCNECGDTIKKGVKYYDIRGLWDGEWRNYKAHKDCHDLLSHLNEKSTYSEYYGFEELIDAIINDIGDPIVPSVISGSTWTAENISIIKAKYELTLL